MEGNNENEEFHKCPFLVFCKGGAQHPQIKTRYTLFCAESNGGILRVK